MERFGCDSRIDDAASVQERTLGKRAAGVHLHATGFDESGVGYPFLVTFDGWTFTQLGLGADDP
jgi:hypothetical protein